MRGSPAGARDAVAPQQARLYPEGPPCLGPVSRSTRNRDDETASPAATGVGVHGATLASLGGRGAHDAADDLHPRWLDPREAGLEAALAREGSGAARGRRGLIP